MDNLYDLAKEAGYTVVKTQAEAEQVTSGPVIIVDEHLADSDAMAYELDRTDDMWSRQIQWTSRRSHGLL